MATDQTHAARLAEQIVRDHEELCCGVYESETPFCASLAPGTQPLCSGCQKLADAIAAALLREPATDAHFCAKCHHRWEGMRAPEVCGDCWRAWQATDARVAALEARIDWLGDALAKMQRHRDQWKRFANDATRRTVRPTDYLEAESAALAVPPSSASPEDTNG